MSEDLTQNPPLTTQSLLAVFVYGTLKPGGMYYKTQCESFRPQALAAWMPGRLYHLPGLEYPAVTVGEDQIQGYVLLFEDHSALALLDVVEEYNPEDPANSLYQRESLTVETEQGPYQVWVYRMSPEQVENLGGVYEPSGVWDHLLARNPRLL